MSRLGGLDQYHRGSPPPGQQRFPYTPYNDFLPHGASGCSLAAKIQIGNQGWVFSKNKPITKKKFERAQVDSGPSHAILWKEDGDRLYDDYFESPASQ